MVKEWLGLLQISFWVRVKHALARPHTPSHALARPQPSQPQNPTPSPGCETPWGPTHCTQSFIPLPPLLKLRACFTLEGKSRPQLFLGVQSWGRLLPSRVKHALRPKTLPDTKPHTLRQLWDSLTWSLWHGQTQASISTSVRSSRTSLTWPSF